MNHTVTIVEEDLRGQLASLQQRSSFSEIADLLTFSLKNGSSELNRQVFGYIPSLFREISITNPVQGILPAQINIGEPVIYKISFPQEQTIRGIPHFYIFCYLKQHSSRLTVYFQSAARTSQSLTQRQYTIEQKRIKFEGLISAFKEPESAICISDPGHFIPDLISSFYVGSRQINFPELLGNIIESICVSADIKLESTFLFGSSAGGMGALLSSTYLSQKAQVMAVNAQIITYDLAKVMLKLLGTKERRILLKQFANRVSCLNRFQQNISSVPNIYLLTNVNDSLHHRNYKFYQLYQKHFVAKGQANQSIFDSYYGVEGHGRPDKVSLKQKMEIAKTSLTMKSNIVRERQYPTIEPAKQHQHQLKFQKLLTLQKQLLEANVASAVKPKPDRPNLPLLPDLESYQHSFEQVNKQINIEAANSNYSDSPQFPSAGLVSPDNSVIVGKNGWLFINSGTNNLIEYHTGQKRLPLAKVAQWSELLSQRISWHNAQKIAYQHIFIPNKIAVYGEHYPEALSIVGKRPIVQLQEQCDRLFSYPLELFRQYKHQYRLYEKQDCHWSFWGCYLTYQHLCQQLQISPNNDLINAPIEIINAKGDLGSKLGLTEISLRKNLKLNSQLIYDNQVIKYCNQGSIRVLKNHSVPHGKIIIFGDSFSNPKHLDAPANIRRTGRLTSLFAETVNEVHFVWTPWIDYDYIEREKPDFVLTEMAERFLVRVPNDQDHLPLEEFAAMRLNQHQSN